MLTLNTFFLPLSLSLTYIQFGTSISTHFTIRINPHYVDVTTNEETVCILSHLILYPLGPFFFLLLFIYSSYLQGIMHY